MVLTLRAEHDTAQVLCQCEKDVRGSSVVAVLLRTEDQSSSLSDLQHPSASSLTPVSQCSFCCKSQLQSP